MKPTVTVKGGDKLLAKIDQLIERVRKPAGVLVGVPASAGASDEGTPLAVIAAANEFGADIEHPGGTPYGYMSKEDAEAGRVRFLPKGQGFMVLGETDPHTIQIPERSFLRVPLRAAAKDISRAFRKGIPSVLRGQLKADDLLGGIGSMAVGVVQEAISSGIGPANAPSTIAKKGSSKPLIDSGHMRQSVTYVIQGADDVA